MTDLEDDLRAALRARAQALPVPDRPVLGRDVVEPRHRGPRWLMAAACVALIAAGLVALVMRGDGDPEPAPPAATVVPDTTAPVVPDTTAPNATVTSVVPDATAPAPVVNGWVALDSDGDIYLVRPGEVARRLEVPGSDTANEACPAWSPDGARLSFGRVTSSSDSALGAAELVIVPVGPDGTIGVPGVIALDGFGVPDDFDPHPCAIWAPDGRWVAFGGRGEVWVVDTQSSEIRRLPDLRPSDLEWRPGTDQLAIAGDVGTNRAAPTLSTPVTTYSVSAGDLGQLGSVEAAHITWSPDGSTLAYQGGEDDTNELWLVDADGTNERSLVADPGEAIHGIGPVWSPTGDRIAYQRLECDFVTTSCGERHEVVLVSVADGTQTVIDPPQTGGPNGPMLWYPYSVTWSPDGNTLLYTAWNQEGGGTIAVAADTPTSAAVISGAIGPTEVYSHRWASVQRWGRANSPLQDGSGPISTVTSTYQTAGDGPTILAKGHDVQIAGVGDSSRTLNIDAQEQAGVVTGEFQVDTVVVAIQCAGVREGGRDLILAGVVTDNTGGNGARLDGITVAVGDLVALIIRNAPTPARQRVTLYQPSLWYGEQADEHTGSCSEVVESVPINLDGGLFKDVEDGSIKTG